MWNGCEVIYEIFHISPQIDLHKMLCDAAHQMTSDSLLHSLTWLSLWQQLIQEKQLNSLWDYVKMGSLKKIKSSLSHFEILKEASKKASNILKTTVHLE